MKKRSAALGFATALILGAGACGTKPTATDAGGAVDDAGGGGTDGGGATDGGGTASDAGALKWYMTCGDPACSTHRDAGVALCTTEDAGAACATEGVECDPVNDCNAYLRCAATDPRAQPWGCPISVRDAKRRVRYLDDAATERLARALLNMPLATYEYRAAPKAGLRLGFIIDDVAAAAPFAIAADGRHVDVYGYASMAVAALKAQAREIAALKREMEALRREVAGASMRRRSTNERR